MASISKSFTAVGSSENLLVKHGSSINYAVSGTFAATAVIERSTNGGASWETFVAGMTAAATGTALMELPDGGAALVRIRCSAFTSGTMVTSMEDAVPVLAKKRLLNLGAKVGATAGFVVAAAADVRLITCPASQTGSTCVIPVAGLNVGDKIVGFHLEGQIESGGNAVTVDAALRSQTDAAADIVDAAVASMTQLSVSADAVMSQSNTFKGGLDVVVGLGVDHYFLITVTTGASTDVALRGVVLHVVPA